MASMQILSETCRGLIHDAPKHLDVERARPLISIDHKNSTSPHLTIQSNKMNDPFQNAKNRFHRISTPCSSTLSPPAPNHHQETNPWKREALQSTHMPSAQSTSHQAVAQTPNLQSSNSVLNSNESVPLSAVQPGPVWPTENQMMVAHTYGIRRENGTYTRLIPADEIADPINHGVHATQGPEGMIVLPQLQLPPVEKRDNKWKDELVPNNIINSLPLNQLQRPGSRVAPDVNRETQMHIDSIIAASSGTDTSPATVPRRLKIYCDKWIHEGVCAFTQLGCKYKHEMPMDKATQMSLGLNHGIPNWYKRANNVQLRIEPQPTTPLGARTTGGTPWRKANTTPTSSGSSPSSATLNMSNMQGSTASRTSHGPSSFGPIGPPSRSPAKSGNPYATLDTNMNTDEDSDSDGETLTWTGRKR